MRLSRELVWIKGAGDLATGVAYRLLMAGYQVFLTELPQPMCVRRLVSFAEAVPLGIHTVERFTAVRVGSLSEARAALAAGLVPVAPDPANGADHIGRGLAPCAIVDAIMAKRNLCTQMTDGPIVIAVGPGFTVGSDCHAVVETNRGHHLGRTLYQGSAAPDTGVPGQVAGMGAPRVVRAPATGRFAGLAEIGALVHPGEILGSVIPDQGEPVPVRASIGGVLRGLIRTDCWVPIGIKIGDVDPTGEVDRCHTISDKALAIGGGVLEAVLHLQRAVPQSEEG
jgi:xanthine dehydrogenase accessory factor